MKDAVIEREAKVVYLTGTYNMSPRGVCILDRVDGEGRRISGVVIGIYAVNRSGPSDAHIISRQFVLLAEGVVALNHIEIGWRCSNRVATEVVRAGQVAGRLVRQRIITHYL